MNLMLELIPVIDLQAGCVVHAQRGLRHQYRPLTSFGDGTGNPFAVIAAYLDLAPFRTLYLADLDALTGKTPQRELVESLSENFPGLRFWVDAGDSIRPKSRNERVSRVLGSESLPSGLSEALSSNEVLSLDFRDGQLLGDAEVLRQTGLWPKRVIWMNLSVVGSLEGPDLQSLSFFREKHPDIDLYAAGGIRNEADLEALQALGVSGVLLATAIYTGRLTAETIRRWVGASLGGA
jgi:phosphoribosylformimino-5-aminoimidazole carboxamide ribotide isomerase